MLTESKCNEFIATLRRKLKFPEDYDLTFKIAPLEDCLGMFVPITTNIGIIYLDTQHARTAQDIAVYDTLIHEMLHARMSFMVQYAERRMSEYEKTEFVEYEEEFIEAMTALLCEVLVEGVIA
jgi:hypothetical protein